MKCDFQVHTPRDPNWGGEKLHSRSSNESGRTTHPEPARLHAYPDECKHHRALSYQPLPFRVLLLQFLQPLRLVYLSPPLLTPTEVGLLHDPRILDACAVVFPFATATSILRSKLNTR